MKAEPASTAAQLRLFVLCATRKFRDQTGIKKKGQTKTNNPRKSAEAPPGLPPRPSAEAQPRWRQQSAEAPPGSSALLGASDNDSLGRARKLRQDGAPPGGAQTLSQVTAAAERRSSAFARPSAKAQPE